MCLPSSTISYVSVQTLDDVTMCQIFGDCNANVLYKLKHPYFDMSLHPFDTIQVVREKKIYSDILLSDLDLSS